MCYCKRGRGSAMHLKEKIKDVSVSEVESRENIVLPEVGSSAGTSGMSSANTAAKPAAREERYST